MKNILKYLLVIIIIITSFNSLHSQICNLRIKDYLNDIEKDVDFKNYLDGIYYTEFDDALVSYKFLHRNGRPILRHKEKALIAFRKLRNHSKFSITGMTNDFVAKLLKDVFWTSPPNIPSYDNLLDDMLELLNKLPDNVTSLDKYFGSSGWANASNYTKRHAYVHLKRILEPDNAKFMKNADITIFENPINDLPFGNSVSDQTILKGGRRVEIETKGGVEFFNNSPNSNYPTQSANSIVKAGVKDFKTFLNPAQIEDLANNVKKSAYKQKIIDGWSNPLPNGVHTLDNADFRQRFVTYWSDVSQIENSTEFENLLKTRDDWFDDIYLSNIKINL